MSDNLKLRRDPTSHDLTSGEALSNRLPRPPDADPTPTDDAESQMRKALGLLGETPRHRSDIERSDQPSRMNDRFNAGLHRRRFVQDGDIPVTVLRRDQGHEPPVHRGAAATPQPPSSSRLQRTEAALAAETAARERAERLLGEAQAALRDLQTKIGHAELTKNEAAEALRREREAVAQLRADGAALEARLQETLEQLRLAQATAQDCQAQAAAEQQARRTAEQALHEAEMARDAAQNLVGALSQEHPAAVQPVEPTRRWAEPARRSMTVAEPEAVAAPIGRRLRSKPAAASEPEPVKWWLNPKPPAKKR